MTIQTSAATDDDTAVQVFANAMCRKLAKKRADGRSGWQQCEPEQLAMLLLNHIVKGDPVDIANFAMFLGSQGRKPAVIRKALRSALKDFVLDHAYATIDPDHI